MPSKLSAALYHRVSTRDQNAGNARKELRGAARRNGFAVKLDIQETGSGARNDRPGLARILTAARKGNVQVVLVWKLDRFGRSALDLLYQLRELETLGVRFMAISQGLDIRPGGDAMSRLMLTLLGAIAEFERELIGERTRLGLDRARAEGKQLGRPRLPGPESTEVARLRAAGWSWSEIAAHLKCSVWKARQALAENGTPRSHSKPGRKAAQPLK